MSAWLVVDLGFGDAGKGALTDRLVRAHGVPLVVRHHGGAQAGHNVVTAAGLHHTFSQFGAGTFAGARTLLGPDFLLHPLGMAVEAEHLARHGIDAWALTEVDARARLITPYQQAANRVRERLRGADAHGTCGIGVGECVADDLAHPGETLRAGDLDNARKIRTFMTNQRERKRGELRALGAEDLAIFDDPELIGRVIDAWSAVGRRLVRLDPDAVASRIDRASSVVFEGAQGVLLDQTWGFHPHTTWSDCTPASARALTERPITRIGVLRAYAVRHGAGPLPTETDDGPAEAHNAGDGWQGRFRVGALDGVLLRYALEVCGGVDALALTHLDRAPGQVCDAYDGPLPAELVRVRDGRIHALVPGDPADLGHRERLGRLLRQVRPVRAFEDPRAFVERVSGLPIGYEGRGPRAVDWTLTGGAP